MTRQAPPQYAMAAGEISELLHGRPDYQRNQTGLHTCRGFVPLRQGGVTRQPGTLHRGSTKSDAAARLLPFVFARDDAMVVELTNQLARFWRYGALVEDSSSPGTVYELATPIEAADLATLQAAQTADVTFIADGKRPIQSLARSDLDDWSIAAAAFKRGPFAAQNTDEAVTVQASAETGTVTLTGVGGVFEADHVGGLFRLEAVSDDVPIWTGNTSVTTGDRMQLGGRYYEVVSGSNTGQNAPEHTSGDQLSQKSGGVTWRYIGTNAGVVRITAVANANSATATVETQLPSGVVSSATWAWSEGAWSEKNGYPAAVAIYDSRLWAAGTPTAPRTIWASARGDFLDMEPTDLADGAFAYGIDGDSSVNRILWLRQGSNGLFVGALGEEYSVTATDGAEAIGLLNISFKMESQIGSAPIVPIAPRGKPIFISGDKSRVFELRYSFDERKNMPVELSLPSEHLGNDGFEDVIWQSAPIPLAWLRTGTGELVMLNHEPSEDVLGWAAAGVANGEVESIVVTPAADGRRDVVTMVVKRTINGSVVRFVEDHAPFYGVVKNSAPVSDAVHLFAAKEYTLASATDTFTGLDHLEGEEVYVWSDAGEIGPATVTGGAVTATAEAATRAVVGLQDDSQKIRTLDVVATAQDGATNGRQKILMGFGVRLLNTAGLQSRPVAKTFGRAEKAERWRDVLGLGVPADATQGLSGVADLDQTGTWATEAFYEFRPVGGAPATITGLVPVIDLGGD